MVCVPCIVVPVALWVFYRFLQPLFLRLYALWTGKKLESDTTVKDSLKILEFTEEMLKSEQGRYIQSTLKENPVVVFTKTTCNFCQLVKKTFNELNVSYAVEEIDKRSDTEQIQDLFEKLTSERTVPRVFIGGRCVGGANQTLSLNSKGQLVPLMKEAGASFSTKEE